MANIEASGKTRILLTKSAIPNKLPDTSGMTYGEVFVNYASGVGKSFLSTKKNDNTLAQFMEKSYNDGAYADKGDYEKFKSDVEDTYATVDALSALTDNVIENEYVVAHAITTINQSAGFDENGNSTLGMSLTDAIKELQENGGANVQAIDTGDVIDDVNIDYATKTYVDGLVGDINSVLDDVTVNYATKTYVDELVGDINSTIGDINNVLENIING